MSKKRITRNTILVAAVLAVTLFLAVLVQQNQTSTTADLPDGTRIRLAHVAYTNSYTYTRRSLPGWLQPLAPVIPDRLEERLLKNVPGSSSIGIGSGPTNLLLVLEATSDQQTPPFFNWIRISDEQGNSFENSQLRGQLGGTDTRASVFLLSNYPKRTRALSVEIPVQIDNVWTNVGPFEIENPEYRDYPQWTPKPLPQSRTNGDVTATLKRFESGMGSAAVAGSHIGGGASRRTTFISLAFGESGKPSGLFRIHGITVSDATGNDIANQFNYLRPRSLFAWVDNGNAEFLGGLWPGEDAWTVKVAAVRRSQYDAAEIWDAPPTELPNPGEWHAIDSSFELDGSTIRLGPITSPGVELADRWQWVLRYHGDEPDVYALGLENLQAGGRRPFVVEARSESGAAFKIIQHQYVDSTQQAIFVQPPPEGANELHLKIAFPELKTFEFLARPEFVDRIDPDIAAEEGR